MPKKNTGGKKQASSERPARTREHYIADLSLNHVERFALLEGYAVSILRNDYVYDVSIRTYDYKNNTQFEGGDTESGRILLYIQATDNLDVLRDEAAISITVSRKHVELWQKELMPVILIIYDVAAETAYWLYAQRCFNSPAFRMTARQQWVAVHIPKANIVSREAMQTFRQFKNRVMQRIQEELDLHA